MAMVIEAFLHFLAKAVYITGGVKAPVCKSLVAVLVGEGLNSALVEQGELQDEQEGCE
jgi:hypothetical protein